MLTKLLLLSTLDLLCSIQYLHILYRMTQKVSDSTCNGLYILQFTILILTLILY